MLIRGSIRWEKCKKTAINYITGEESEEYDREKQSALNASGKCPHYIKRTGPIKEIKDSAERFPMCDVEMNVIPLKKNPWFKRLFKLK